MNQLSSMLVGSSIIANAIMEDYKVLGRREEETTHMRAEVEATVNAAREGAEQLEKDRAVFEKLKQTETWVATASLKQAANAALMKEKVAAEAATKEAEGRASNVLEEADAGRSKLNKAVEDLKVTARVGEAEARVREAADVRDSLTTSLNQLKVDRDWMRTHSIGHIVRTVLDVLENATAVNELKERARQDGFKVGYNECLSHVNPFYQSKFTDERSKFHGIDT
ncbi:hypothetical protein Hdeb2414_s0005g00158601 [Helianthus debilis subsp. tardiflorus]